jgi:hypothetical protein
MQRLQQNKMRLQSQSLKKRQWSTKRGLKKGEDYALANNQQSLLT